MERLILHCDLNNFYASVECLTQPQYKDVPLAVSGNADSRHGVILAKNELAKAKGIKTGDVIWQAKQKEPNLVLVPPHFETYMYYSKRAFDIYSRYTSQVEPFGADECYLDCSGSAKLFGDGVTIADTLRKVVYEELGLTISVGVSFNKAFAKLASDMKKPNGTTLISRENFKTVAWDLPACDLLMVGRRTSEKLSKLNIHTIGQLACADKRIIREHFGINGLKLVKSASGLDDESVREYVIPHENESVGHGMTAIRDITREDDMQSLLYYLSEKIAKRLKEMCVSGFGVAVSLRSSKLDITSKQCKLSRSIKSSNDIAQNAMRLAKIIWDGVTPLRSMTISIFDLLHSDEPTQMSFDIDKKESNERLDSAIMKIRGKYGADAIKRANLIERDFIYDKNDAEDFLPFQR